MEIAYELDFFTPDTSENAQYDTLTQSATLSALALMMHIGCIGLTHSLPFIRHHSGLLLLHILHATAFTASDVEARLLTAPNRQSAFVPYSATASAVSSHSRLSSAPSAGLAVAIHSQQMKSVGARQRRALRLMDRINKFSCESSSGSVEVRVLVTDLLLVVPPPYSRETLSHHWQNHAIEWALTSAPSSDAYAIASHQVYRALEPPFITRHYRAVMNGVELRSQQRDVTLLESLRTLTAMTQRLNDAPNERQQPPVTTPLSLLRRTLLPPLLWRAIRIISAFADETSVTPFGEDLVADALAVLESVLTVVETDIEFEGALQAAARDDERCRFYGLQPLIIRAVITGDHEYRSLTQLNTVRSKESQSPPPANWTVSLRSIDTQSAATNPQRIVSWNILNAVQQLITRTMVGPLSPVASLIDSASFVQRICCNIIMQIPFFSQNIDKTANTISMDVAGTSDTECGHTSTKLMEDTCITAALSLCHLLRSLGLIELSDVFRCLSIGHYINSTQLLLAIAKPLTAAIPANIIGDLTLMLVDCARALAAFQSDKDWIRPHPLSVPRDPKVYAQSNHKSPPLTLADIIQRPHHNDNADAQVHAFSHYCLMLTAVLIDGAAFSETALSTTHVSALVIQLESALRTRHSQAATHILCLLFDRLDGASNGECHLSSSMLTQPRLAPTTLHYEPNPRLSSGSAFSVASEPSCATSRSRRRVRCGSVDSNG